MSQISEAIAARQTQIAQPQTEIETLQRAASIMGDGAKAPAKATRPKATAQPKPQPKKKPGAPWSAARRQRMKAYWAKRKKASGPVADAPSQPTATQQPKRKPMSTAAKKALSKRMKKYWAKRRKAKG